MFDYATATMPELMRVFYSLKPEIWRHVADTWRATADGINGAQAGLDAAWRQTPVFQLNDGDPEAKAFASFTDNIGLSQSSAKEWTDFATNVSTCLAATAKVIEDNRPFVEAARLDWERASKDVDKEIARRRAALYVWNVANKVRDTFNGIRTPQRAYQGPMGPKPDDERAGGGDPNAQGAGAGAGAAGDGGQKPADTPAAPKAPEAKDPVEQAGKLIDVVGKGIDLVGKPADVAGKYVSLAKSLKDLIDQGGGTGTEGLNLDSVLPDAKYAEYSDQPTLAGGVGTAPSFDPTTLTGAGSPGGGGGSPAIGPTAGLGAVATGGVGAAPSLAGKASSATSAGTQQSMSPMYPPMSGMGAAGAGAGGRGEIKPGSAQARAGFSMPAEQSESERWRRHGVQADLQGRTNGEQRTASAVPPIRKRKGHARTNKPVDQGVLDEELWRT
ncbi:hypothetical protein [Flindersiella endophytica]